MNKNKQTINPTKEYNIADLVRLNVFPWIKYRRAYKNFILKHQKQLRVRTTGFGNGTEYHIKGKHLLDLLEKVTPASQILLMSK